MSINHAPIMANPVGQMLSMWKEKSILVNKYKLTVLTPSQTAMHLSVDPIQAVITIALRARLNDFYRTGADDNRFCLLRIILSTRQEAIVSGGKAWVA
jgi:hypothetical protein